MTVDRAHSWATLIKMTPQVIVHIWAMLSASLDLWLEVGFDCVADNWPIWNVTFIFYFIASNWSVYCRSTNMYTYRWSGFGWYVQLRENMAFSWYASNSGWRLSESNTAKYCCRNWRTISAPAGSIKKDALAGGNLFESSVSISKPIWAGNSMPSYNFRSSQCNSCL